MIADLQRNSPLSPTLKCDNLLDVLGDKQSSYYVGVDSGRISDQKDGQYMLDDLDKWLDFMEGVISVDKVISSNLLHSFAKPIPVDLRLAIEDVIMDFSDLPHPINVRHESGEVVLQITGSYIWKILVVWFLACDSTQKLVYHCADQSPFIVFESEEEVLYDINGRGEEYGDFIELLSESLHKVLLEKGVSYLKGRFYELRPCRR